MSKRRRRRFDQDRNQGQLRDPSIDHLPLYTIYTDGGCEPNPGDGAYAAIVIDPNLAISELAGPVLRTTNNRCEILALIHGLESVPVGSRVKVYSDSQYVINGSTQWAAKWERNNWMRGKQPALNPDLWTQVLRLLRARHVTFQWVRGHSGNLYNERADELCAAIMRGQPHRGSRSTDIEDRLVDHLMGVGD